MRAGEEPAGRGLGYNRAVPSEAALRALSGDLDAAEPDEGPDGRRSRGSRRASGAYFTPPALVRFVVAEALRARAAGESIRWRDDGTPALRILDPAAGDGRFLAEAGRQLARWAASRGADSRAVARSIARRCLVGVERDPAFAAAARRALGAPVVQCGEALLDPPRQLADPVDVVVGNPPYLRSIHLGAADAPLREALRGRFAATSYGEWDLYAAFLEQSLAWAAPGAEVGLVVPSRWLTAAFAVKLREKLAEARAVRAIVDFGAHQIFGGATTYASVVFLSRRRQPRVEVARLESGSWERGSIDAASLDDRPWRVSVGARRDALSAISRGPALGDVARVAKGAGTNADRVFLLEDARARGGRVFGYSPHRGRRVEVEANITAPCVRGRDVEPYGAVPRSLRCIIPYEREGRLYSAGALAAAFPLAAAHFEACRARLEARERGRFAGATYYCFGRPQNLSFHRDSAPKVVFPDVAREGRALLDTTGAMLLDTAYALRTTDEGGYPLGVVLAVMNSPIVALWLRETGIRLRGDYVRMKTAYLASLPLPPPSRHTRALADLGRRAAGGDGRAASAHPAPSREELGDLLRRAYGLSTAAWAGLSRA